MTKVGNDSRYLAPGDARPHHVDHFIHALFPARGVQDAGVHLDVIEAVTSPAMSLDQTLSRGVLQLYRILLGERYRRKCE